MIATVAIVALTVVIGILARENRRLTNLLLSKNPAAVVAAEQAPKARKPKKDDQPGVRSAWQNPSEAVGP